MDRKHRTPKIYDREHDIPAHPALLRIESGRIKKEVPRGYEAVASEQAARAASRDVRRDNERPGWTIPRILAIGATCLLVSGTVNHFMGKSQDPTPRTLTQPHQ